MRDAQLGEQSGHARVEDRHIFSTGLVTERAGEPALAETARAGDDEIAALGDPIAAREFEEQPAVESMRLLIVDVLDAGGVTQFGGPGPCFKLLLSAQRQFIFEQQSEPFGVIETARFGLVFEFPESLGQAMKTEGVQLIECRDERAWDFHSMVVAGTTQIGVIEKRGGTAFLGRGVVRLAGEKGGDALAVEDAQFEGAAETASTRAASMPR